MNKYLLSGLCLLAMNNSADAQPLTLPTGTITAEANDGETVSLNTPTTAGSRLILTALETPASVESLTGAGRGVAQHRDQAHRHAGRWRHVVVGAGFYRAVMQLYDGNRM